VHVYIYTYIQAGRAGMKRAGKQVQYDWDYYDDGGGALIKQYRDESARYYIRI
jgi:hypothetical protein